MDPKDDVNITDTAKKGIQTKVTDQKGTQQSSQQGKQGTTSTTIQPHHHGIFSRFDNMFNDPIFDDAVENLFDQDISLFNRIAKRFDRSRKESYKNFAIAPVDFSNQGLTNQQITSLNLFRDPLFDFAVDDLFRFDFPSFNRIGKRFDKLRKQALKN